MARERTREVLRFGAVGAAAGVVDVGGSNLLHYGLAFGPLTAKVLSTAVSVAVAYLGNRLWAFRHRAAGSTPAASAREALLFVLLNGVALVIALACVAFTRYGLGQDGPLAYNLSANVVGLGLGTAFRYWSYRTWVFNAPRPPDGSPLPAGHGAHQGRRRSHHQAAHRKSAAAARTAQLSHEQLSRAQQTSQPSQPSHTQSSQTQPSHTRRQEALDR